jgi:hypothetical protein
MKEEISFRDAMQFHKKLAENNTYYDLTNGRTITKDKDTHREKVLSGGAKIAKFIERGISIQSKHVKS